MKSLIPKVTTLLGLALACPTLLAAADLIPTPGAMQPGGDTNDTTLDFGIWWLDNATVTEEFDTSMRSRPDIAGSIHVVFDCPGGTVLPIRPSNLAFGNFFNARMGNNNWLGAGVPFDVATYARLTMDINIAAAVSSNTTIPITLFGASYTGVVLTNLPITTPGWQHLNIHIPLMINLPDCTAYGVSDWYNTTSNTPPAHVEYWFDNVRLVTTCCPPPPPTLSIRPVAEYGLLFDSAPGQSYQRGAIVTATNVSWIGVASPGSEVTYAMTVSSVPDPMVYSNYEAQIILAPLPGAIYPDWDLSDVGYLQVLDQSDGTATACVMWKTNSPMSHTMQTLGYLSAPTMLGTWSITFTSDTDFVVRGPGGVSTNFSLPYNWVARFESVSAGAAYAYFGGQPYRVDNAGQPMYLSKVSAGGGGCAFTNDFTTPLNTALWTLTGGQSALVLPQPGWWLKWDLPAADFNLWARANMASGAAWTLLSGNTNLPVPVTTYTSGTNIKALVATAVLPGTNGNFFALRKLVAARLQVLMPGETNAPFTLSGKTGMPEQQSTNGPVFVTVNAVDVDWNIVTTWTDVVHISSSDTNADLPSDFALLNGTGTFPLTFGTIGGQTVTAADITNPGIAPNTGSATMIHP